VRPPDPSCQASTLDSAAHAAAPTKPIVKKNAERAGVRNGIGLLYAKSTADGKVTRCRADRPGRFLSVFHTHAGRNHRMMPPCASPL
jgi:hypothetical protein